MKTLIINDLAVSAELDGKTMGAIHGGRHVAMPGYWGSLFELNKGDVTFNADQSLAQSQNTVVNNGNNAAFVSGITANVNPTQSGKNVINFL